MTSVLLHDGRSEQQRMNQLLLALAPVIIGSAWLFGYQILINSILCVLFGIGCEAIARLLRRLPGRGLLRDRDTALLALLLGISLPPVTPWWQLLLGMGFAILLVKHAYGGVGQSPFHPAMAALLFLWLAFPETLSGWPESFGAMPAEIGAAIDSGTASSWAWINLLTLACGIYLLWVRAVAWQIPLGLALSLALLSLLSSEAQTGTSIELILTQLFYGFTMLCAFFIATDPASAAMTRTGQFVYGLLIGATLYGVRVFGDWPEGFAAAVVLANFCAPLIDELLRQSPYGTGRKPSFKRSTEAEQ